MTTISVWDWPLRLFHWLLVIAVSGCYITGTLGGSLTDWHNRFGQLTLGLLIFRLLWGFFGGTHARFASFLPTPVGIRQYLRGEWQGLGHNPIGALAVFALLAVLLALVTTGLFANDDIVFEGPLYPLVDKALSDKLSVWHNWLSNPLLVIVGLHLAAMAFYRAVKGIDLVKPMLTGNKPAVALSTPTPAHDSDGLVIVAAVTLPLLLTSLIWHLAD